MYKISRLVFIKFDFLPICFETIVKVKNKNVLCEVFKAFEAVIEIIFCGNFRANNQLGLISPNKIPFCVPSLAERVNEQKYSSQNFQF